MTLIVGKDSPEMFLIPSVLLAALQIQVAKAKGKVLLLRGKDQTKEARNVH